LDGLGLLDDISSSGAIILDPDASSDSIAIEPQSGEIEAPRKHEDSFSAIDEILARTRQPTPAPPPPADEEQTRTSFDESRLIPPPPPRPRRLTPPPPLPLPDEPRARRPTPSPLMNEERARRPTPSPLTIEERARRPTPSPLTIEELPRVGHPAPPPPEEPMRARRPTPAPPPPPRPVRAPDEQRPGVPHRVGIDPTIPRQRIAGQAPPRVERERSERVERIERDRPATRQATSLFHKNVIEDSAPARPITPEPTPVSRRASVDTLWETEIAILRREVAALREREPARAALLLGAQAAILHGSRNDRAGARAAIDDALTLSEERFGLHLLRRDALAERNFPRALELGRRELERITDPKERLGLLVQLGVLEESVGNDRAAARKAFEAARELDPRHAAPALALVDLYLDEKQWEPLAAAYHALADTSSDPLLRGMFRHAAGVVEERGLEKPATARETYRAALTEDPSNLPSVVALSSLALRSEDWGELARALEAEAEQLKDAAAQRRLYERAGDLYWERLSDAESATMAYRKAALAAPHAPGPLRRLSAVLESIGRWHELVDVLTAELPLSRSPEERSELHHLIGEVKENHLERPDEALQSYEAALAEVPDHVASLQALAGLFARTRRLDALMRAELGEAERIVDPARRAARYLHLGDVALHVVGDEVEAARLYERCAELEKGHRAATQGLETIHRRRCDFVALAALHERQAEQTKSASLRRFYLLSAARALLEANRRDDGHALLPDFLQRVEQHLRAGQKIDTPDLTPLCTLADAYEDAGQWDPLVTALAALGEKLDDPADQIGLLHRTARIQELRLGADGKALATYELILSRDATHEAALLAVVRLHQRAGRGAQEIEALGRLRDRAATPAEGAALSYRIGRIYERRIGDTEAAILAYEEALARKPDFGPAPRALERLLRRDRRWPRLVEVLDRQLATARGTDERAELRYAIGQIEELHQRNLDRAEDAYTLALKEVPGHDQAGAALAQVREAKKDLAGLSRLLEEQRTHTHDTSTTVALLCRLGALAEGPLAEPGRAVKIYTSAIEGGDALGSRLSVSLWRASRRDGGVPASTAALRALADRVTEPRLQTGARLLVALREELASGDAAARVFERADNGPPHDAVILDGQIRRLLGAAGSPDEERVGGLLVERARIVDSAALRALMYLEAACRYDRLAFAPESGAALEAADQAVNDMLPILRGVRRIAVKSEQWVAAALLFAHEAELSRDPENRAEALMQAGEISLAKVGDARQALEHFRRLLATQPLHEAASERAGSILERAKDWLGLTALHRQRAEALTDPAARAQAWHRKAEVERDRLRDVPSALASLRAALTATPDDLEAHKAIAPLQEHQRFWQDAIETYRKISELSRGDALARAAKIREAELRERELGDRDGARSLLAELTVDPSDRDAARRMAHLCERMGRWDEAQAMWTQLSGTRDPAERADALVSLGAVLERGQRDQDAALGCYVDAMAVALGHADVVARIEERFREMGMLPIFAEAAERALENAAPGPAQLELRITLARIYLDDLRRNDLADQQLTICTELVPEEPAAYRRLGELFIETGRPENALPLIHRALELEPSSPESLRALGEGLGHTGLTDAPHIFDSAAAFIEGGAPPSPLAPLVVRRTLMPDEWPIYFPRETGPARLALSELARTVETFAPSLIVELTGEQPHGELLAPGKVESAARATFQALGLQPLRIFLDPDLGAEAVLCADQSIAINIGPSLLEPARQGRLIFEIARLGVWIAQGETLGAFLRGRALSSFIQAACDEGGDEEVREVRRRIGKAIPRKQRKELERFGVPLADAAGTATAWERSGYAAAEELALLVCRDAGVVFEAIGLRAGEALPARGRSIDIVRFLASEDCWRAYRRLVDG
jgi:tetratricopeptide (TPR) repeat protein